MICWSADLKSKTTKDIISIGSFIEVLVLNNYVLVRKILVSHLHYVLITGASQRRQHESRKSPTAELFDADYGRISIHHLRFLMDLISSRIYKCTLLFGNWRLERTVTFSISTISE
ncbi:hypothetical protein Tco_1465827 [Tanacetum coccineum]